MSHLFLSELLRMVTRGVLLQAALDPV
eukprot:COSAG02_NODE_36292_length_456_cov_1.263305_1_plen_26_part_01